MAKTPNKTTGQDKRKQEERALLESWHPHIENAMKRLQEKFQSDTKFILTESDLKCWLFYYLQAEKPYKPYVVHTEVTHYAMHKENDKEPKKKYKFRDLSLLSPYNIKDAGEIWDENNDNFVYSKGFKHKGPAIHFELKVVRQSHSENQTRGLESDIDKLKSYAPNANNPVRDFVIVCGSRSGGTNIQQLKKAVENKFNGFKNQSIMERLHLCLFDNRQMVCGKWNGKNFDFNNFIID